MNDGGYMAVSPLNSNIVFATGNVYNSAYYVGVSHSSDGGTTWEHDTIALGTRGWAVAFDGVDPNRVYVGGDSEYSYPALLITTDCGTTWTMSHTGLAGTVNVLQTVPGNGQLVCAGTNNGVFRSTDAGVTWNATSVTQQVRALVIDPGNPLNIYAGTYGAGVYASTDGGTTWSAMNTGLTCNNVLSLALRGSDGMLIAGTEGGSCFRTSLPTGIWTSLSPLAPHPSLSVFPNPCHATTCVSFSAPREVNPRLTVYDASGRFVSSFEHVSSPFVLRTSHMTPGAYFVRLSTGTQTNTIRLTVLK